MVHPDSRLEAKADSIISYIAAAQEDDGYIYTPLTNKAFHLKKMPKERWVATHTESHELYCLGHMYEAAVAYWKATGKRTFLDVAIKNADLVCNEIGWDKLHTFPGHQEIEIGLCKLYRATGEQKYLEQAKFFLDIRATMEDKSGNSAYRQSHKPVLQQTEAVGHCVRGLYMYAGMVDIAAMTGDESYVKAVHKIWKDIVETKTYITGGVGPGNGNGEGFGAKYQLNNLGSYNETCAAIANVYFNHRLFLMDGDAKYIDEMEKALYNNVLSGVSLSGDRFFYPNRIESESGENRKPWFGCACCPSNLCRFLSSFSGYIYAQKDENIYVNLYVANDAELNMGKTDIMISQRGQMPWENNMTINVNPASAKKFTVNLRIPGWARNEASPGNSLYRFNKNIDDQTQIYINGKKLDYKITNKGYVEISRKWKKGDKISISFPMEIREVMCNPLAKANIGKVAIQRGPIVYCAEGIDQEHPQDVMQAVVENIDHMHIIYDSNLGSGMNRIVGNVKRASRTLDKGIELHDMKINMIPYHAWANRGLTPMRVWFPTTIEASSPAPAESIALNSTIRSSKLKGSADSIRDQLIPTESSENIYPHIIFDKKDRQNTIEYIFDKTYKINQTMIFWVAGINNTAVPQSMELYYLKDNIWNKLDIPSGINMEQDQINVIDFNPVEADGIKAVITPEKGKLAGMHEWIVN